VFEQKKYIQKSEETHQTAQLPTLAAFLPWGDSEGAGCMPLTERKITINFH